MGKEDWLFGYWLLAVYPRSMRLFYVLACGLSLPLFVSLLFAQSTQQQQTPPAQPPASEATPAQPQAGAPSLQLHDLPADPHTPTPEEQAQQKAAQMRMQLARIASAQANWGPAISTPGMSLTLKETGRTSTANGTAITWQLIGTGFTPQMQLALLRWPLNQAVTRVMSGIVVNAEGIAVCEAAPTLQAPASTPGANADQTPSCTKAMQPGTPITVTSTAAKGEAVRVALVASDQKHGAAVSLVPFPIESEDKGCKLQVVRGAKDDELVLVEGEGFKQDATFTMGTESYGQKHPLNVKINAQGKFIGALTPWVPTHDSGDTVVYYQSSTCTPTVSFHWGKDTYKAE
jgi:hypothetical protein